MYIYNYALFNNLPTVFGFKLNYLSKMLHVPIATIFFYRQKKDMPLTTLIRVCNELHVSISHFIIPANPEPLILGNRNDYIQEPFTQIEFNHLDIGTALTVSALRTIEETCAFLNISYKTFVRYFRSPEAPTSLTVNEYLRICNKAEMYPGDHLVDYNRKIVVHGTPPKEITMQEKLEARNKQIVELSSNNQSLTTINKRLHAQIKSLTEKNKHLQELIAKYEAENIYKAAEEGGQDYA